MKHNPNIPALLERELETRNLTIRAAAKAFDVPFQQLHSYKTGRREMATDVLIRLMLKAPAHWVREWAWGCIDKRYPGAFIRSGHFK